MTFILKPGQVVELTVETREALDIRLLDPRGYIVGSTESGEFLFVGFDEVQNNIVRTIKPEDVDSILRHPKPYNSKLAICGDVVEIEHPELAELGNTRGVMIGYASTPDRKFWDDVTGILVVVHGRVITLVREGLEFTYNNTNVNLKVVERF